MRSRRPVKFVALWIFLALTAGAAGHAYRRWINPPTPVQPKFASTDGSDDPKVDGLREAFEKHRVPLSMDCAYRPMEDLFPDPTQERSLKLVVSFTLRRIGQSAVRFEDVTAVESHPKIAERDAECFVRYLSGITDVDVPSVSDTLRVRAFPLCYSGFSKNDVAAAHAKKAAGGGT